VRFSLSFPHVPQQRQGDNRAVRDVDDMFTVLTTLDEAENVTLSALPTYVSDNPDNIPCVRLYEGDFGIFMTMLEKLEAKLNLMESAICTAAKDVNTSIRAKVSSLEPGVQSLLQRPPVSSQPVQCDVNNSKCQPATGWDSTKCGARRIGGADLNGDNLRILRLRISDKRRILISK